MNSESESGFSTKAFAQKIREDIEQNRIKLPTLPNIALEALVVVNDCDSCVADVARIVEKDASIATRLIRYANSPLYRGVQPIKTVKNAISRIGFDVVKNAILSLSMKDVFKTGHKPIERRMERLWQHSVAVAAKSAMLAEKIPGLNREEAMLAGLIHDVGVIPILLSACDQPELIAKEQQLDKVIHALHMPIGRLLLTLWKFDRTLIEVAGSHDKMDRQPREDLVEYVDVVQVANILVYDGTSHPYASLDRSGIKAFSKLNLGLSPEEQAEKAELYDTLLRD